MKIIHHIADLLSRHQKKLEFIIIFFLCLAIGFNFSFKDQKTSWLWNDYPFVAVILLMAILLIASIWIRIEKSKTWKLIQEIKQDNSISNSGKENRLDELSARQREVYDLIVIGKSNKEIMNELSIELSTLKTHINKIYKIMQVDSRKEIRKLKNKNE